MIIGLWISLLFAVDAGTDPDVTQAEVSGGCAMKRQAAEHVRAVTMAAARMANRPPDLTVADLSDARARECFAEARKGVLEHRARMEAFKRAQERAQEQRRIEHTQEQVARETQDRMRVAAAQRLAALETEVRNSRPAMRAVTSAQLCLSTERRNTTLADIAKEKRYSRQVGVVNLRHLEDLKEDLKTADAQIRQAKTDLHDLQVAAQPCTADDVRRIVACENDETTDGCDDERMKMLVTFVE